jgi:aerobic-type carbon monoxide dehydrogenase small subunit (CoxS/CutS family)
VTAIGAARYPGSRVPRVEDARLLTGTGTFVDDTTRPGMLRRVAVEPGLTVADLLRERCQLTGTHLGCEHGVCGDSTVLLDGQAVRACLVFDVQADGARVTTIEALSEPDGTLSAAQRFRLSHHRRLTTKPR